MAREEEWKNGALQGVVRSAFSSLVGRVCEALAPKSGGCHQRPPEWDSREDLFLDEGATVVLLHQVGDGEELFLAQGLSHLGRSRPDPSGYVHWAREESGK